MYVKPVLSICWKVMYNTPATPTHCSVACGCLLSSLTLNTAPVSATPSQLSWRDTDIYYPYIYLPHWHSLLSLSKSSWKSPASSAWPHITLTVNDSLSSSVTFSHYPLSSLTSSLLLLLMLLLLTFYIPSKSRRANIINCIMLRFNLFFNVFIHLLWIDVKKQI